MQAGQLKSNIVWAVYKHPNANPDCIAHLKRMLQTYSNWEKKHVYAIGDLNGDLPEVYRLEQISNKLNLYQNLRE